MMDKSKKASLKSQLLDEICEVEDTEEMFWLRESDDYQSCVALGNALAAQYRFKDAIDAYEKARSIKADEDMLYIRIGGANLTLFRFSEAKKNYEKALSYGASEKSLSFPIGLWHYLSEEYEQAAVFFKKCLPCNGEMKIAAIYWHTLAAFRGNLFPELLEDYQSGMDVGHHIAYQMAVSVFIGECEWNQITSFQNELDKAIYFYGLSVYLEHLEKREKANEYKDEVLKNSSVWPCVSYLAAWNDSNKC